MNDLQTEAIPYESLDSGEAKGKFRNKASLFL